MVRITGAGIKKVEVLSVSGSKVWSNDYKNESNIACKPCRKKDPFVNGESRK